MSRIMQKIDAISTTVTTRIIYGCYCSTFLALMIYFAVNYEKIFTESVKSTDLANSFSYAAKEKIKYSSSAYIALSLSTFIELCLDYLLEYNPSIYDRTERLFSCMVLIFPSLFLLFYQDYEYGVFMYPLIISIQYCQCLCSVNTICNRLYPKIFTNTVSFLSIFAMLISTTSALLDLNEELSMYHIASSILATMSVSFYLIAVVRWILCKNIFKNYRIFYLNQLSVKETYVLAYTLSMLFPIMMVFVGGITSNMRWANAKSNDIVLISYSYAVYALVVNTIPGRIAKVSSTRYQNEIITSKQRLIRYVCHELRSPINIVKSNLSFLIESLSSNTAIDQKLVDEVEEMEFACDSAVNVLDEILHLESLETERFDVHLEFLPLVSTFVERLSTQGRLFAKHKEIQVTVINNISQTTFENSYLNIDIAKMQQVMRNLVTNAVKFTPRGGSITIKLSEATDACTSLEIMNKVANIDIESNQASCCCPMNSLQGIHSIKRKTHPDTTITDREKKVVWKTPTLAVEKARESPNDQYTYLTDIVIEIIDSGVGIPTDFLDRLFGEFSQFKPFELQGGGGSGLGLWICKEIVFRHRGSIGCHSRGEGKGSTFLVVLPVYCSKNQQAQLQTETQIIPATNSLLTPIDPTINSIDTNKQNMKEDKINLAMRVDELESHQTINTMNSMIVQKRILVVDDSSLNRKVLIKTIQRCFAEEMIRLRTSNYDLTIEESDDGKDAIERVSQSIQDQLEISLIFMDNIMVDINGPDAALEMRKMNFRNPIIGVTGNGMTQDIDHYVRSGADKILIKPIKKEDIRGWVTSILN